MLVAGIISEYNPFHFGHAALVEQTRSAGATHIVAVMSGNYVQRGEPAMLSKWARTKQALRNGVDLVVELPLPWAIAGAEKFAFGGSALADALGADWLSFGSECGDAEKLKASAQALQSPRLREAIQQELKSGATFARARQNAIEALFGEETARLFSEPNNILGIEYLKALDRLGSGMEPFTIPRIGAAHDAEDGTEETASASRIRKAVTNNEDVTALLPPASAAILREELIAGRAPASINRMERAVLAKLRTMSKDEFKILPDISEGLENCIYTAVRKAESLEEVYSLVKSKRYTHARIRRIVLSAFLGVTADMSSSVPPYIRVLGLNRSGAEILQRAKLVKKLPIISHSSDIFLLDNPSRNMLELESRTTDLYALCMPKVAPCGLDKTVGIITVSPSD